MAKHARDNISLDPGFWTVTSWIQLLYGLWVNLSQVGIGLAFGFPAVQVPQLSSPESHIKITRDEASWIASILTLFSPIGCLLSGYLMDKYGRRVMLIVCQCPICLGWLYTGMAETSRQIIIGRAITGIGCGMAMGPPRIFCSEITLPNMRGVIGAFPALAISLGISMQAGLGYFFAWEILCYVFCAFTFFNFLIFNLLPETPYFLLIKESPECARKNLAKFRGKKYDVESEMLQLIEFKLDNNLRKLTLMEKVPILFSRVSCQPFSFINTYILISQASGVSVILIWAIEILKTANSSFDVHTGNFLMALTRLVVGTFTSILLFRVGRKPLALGSAIGVSLVCFSLGVFIHYNNAPSLVPQVGFMAYMAFASLGYYTLPFLMMAELYPLQIRGMLGGITVSLSSFFIFATTKIFPYIRDSMGLANTIVFFGVCSLFGTLFLYFFLPETHELTLQEIEEFYNARRPTLVSQRRIMNIQLQRLRSNDSDRSMSPYASESDIKNLESMKYRIGRSKESLTKSAKTIKLQPHGLDADAIRRIDMEARRRVHLHPSDVSFHSLKPHSTSLTSLKKYMEQNELYKSKRDLHDRDGSPEDLDKGLYRTLMIHSDESLSFYLRRITIENTAERVSSDEFVMRESFRKKPALSIDSISEQSSSEDLSSLYEKSDESLVYAKPPKIQDSSKKEQAEVKTIYSQFEPQNEEDPVKAQRIRQEHVLEFEENPMLLHRHKKEQNPVIETNPNKEQEPKTKPSAMKKPHTDEENGEKHGPEGQPERVKSDQEYSLARSIDKQKELHRSSESLSVFEDNAVKKASSKDVTSRKVTIDSDKGFSDSDDNISISRAKKKVMKRIRNTSSDEDEGQNDINKPSTSKSRR
ncbi:unnamed protein product [Chrysodeixis includens]|uniref:Major facilitator superfamily (MFS) profile domain-containing protein n=1 Tax=Chrysodeixis includens TaxID=689277 RepID=A0A9P0G0V7_CHRIL|nr:unnamed protein product [Chrysodeixis includens]